MLLESKPGQTGHLQQALHASHAGFAGKSGRAVLADAVTDVLTELHGVVATLSPETFCATGGPVFLGATIGAHVRHVLDHVAPIVDLGAAGTIDYDHRTRGTPTEREPAAASAELLRVTGLLQTVGTLPPDSIEVLMMPRSDGQLLAIPSTIERELAFALSHSIHHCAMVRSMLTAIGVAVPSRFGFAPSTLSHKAGS